MSDSLMCSVGNADTCVFARGMFGVSCVLSTRTAVDTDHCFDFLHTQFEVCHTLTLIHVLSALVIPCFVVSLHLPWR